MHLGVDAAAGADAGHREFEVGLDVEAVAELFGPRAAIGVGLRLLDRQLQGVLVAAEGELLALVGQRRGDAPANAVFAAHGVGAAGAVGGQQPRADVAGCKGVAGCDGGIGQQVAVFVRRLVAIGLRGEVVHFLVGRVVLARQGELVVGVRLAGIGRGRAVGGIAPDIEDLGAEAQRVAAGGLGGDGGGVDIGGADVAALVLLIVEVELIGDRGRHIGLGDQEVAVDAEGGVGFDGGAGVPVGAGGAADGEGLGAGVGVADIEGGRAADVDQAAVGEIVEVLGRLLEDPIKGLRHLHHRMHRRSELQRVAVEIERQQLDAGPGIAAGQVIQKRGPPR